MALVRDDDDVNDTQEEEQGQEQEQEQEQDEEEGAEQGENTEGKGQEAESDGEEPPKRKPRSDRRRERAQEHNRRIEEDRQELRRQNAQLMERLAQMSDAQTQAVQRMADVADNMGKPKPKSVEERMEAEMAEAAAQVLPASQDNGASSAAYFRKMAEINTRYAREIGEQTAQRSIDQAMRRIPRPPSGPNLVYLGIAPWLTDDYHREGVERAIKRLKRDNRNMEDPKTRDRTIREAIVKYANEEQLDVNIQHAPAPRQTPAVGSGGRANFGGSGEESDEPVNYSDFVRRQANDDPAFRHIRNPNERLRAYYNKRVKPFLNEA